MNQSNYTHYYVYFLHNSIGLFYIGSTAMPRVRFLTHHANFYSEYGNFSMSVYGPYDRDTSLSIEANEIRRNKQINKYLKNEKIGEEKSKDIFVKDNERRAVLAFEPNSKRKKVVCEYFDKSYTGELPGIDAKNVGRPKQDPSVVLSYRVPISIADALDGCLREIAKKQFKITLNKKK